MDENKSQFDNSNETTSDTAGGEVNQADTTDTNATKMSAAGSTGAGVGSDASSKPSGLLIAAIVIGAALIAGGLYYYFQGGQTDQLSLDPASSESSPTTATEADEYPEVVATVNGAELTNDELVMSLNQTQQAAAQQGANTNGGEVTEAMETQAIDTLVNTALLIQAAQESDINISDEDVTNEIESLTSQFPSQEAFDRAVAEQGLSEEELRSDMRDQLLIDEFVTNSDEIGTPSVTEAEVEELYNNLSAQQEGLPPLEQLYDSIEQQLTARKQQQLVSDFIQELRETADIEIMI